MTDDEMIFQLREMKRLIDGARGEQEDCRHKHQCHGAILDLWVAETIADELLRELELRQGERLLAATQRIATASAQQPSPKP